MGSWNTPFFGSFKEAEEGGLGGERLHNLCEASNVLTAVLFLDSSPPSDANRWSRISEARLESISGTAVGRRGSISGTAVGRRGSISGVAR